MTARRRKSARRDATPGWLFMLIGLALGLLVAAGVYMSGARSGGGQAPSSASATGDGSRGAANGAAGARSDAKPRTGSASSTSTSTTAPSASTQKSSARTTSTGTKSTRAADLKNAGQRETRFDFYEILPQYEVVVPEVETVTPGSQGSAGASGASAASSQPIEAPGAYILQTGSFRSHGEADRMQASLALLGIESKIQKVTIDADEFHRVRVGPIDDLETLNRVRNQLRAAGINALVMRMNE